MAGRSEFSTSRFDSGLDDSCLANAVWVLVNRLPCRQGFPQRRLRLRPRLFQAQAQ